MATLYIAEYERASNATVGNQTVQIVDESSLLAEQTVTIGAEAKSALFNPQTRIVRLHTDAVCSILFGAAPTATTAKKRLAANATEYFGVPSSSGWKLSCISNT